MASHRRSGPLAVRKIQKRDGSVVAFDSSKISAAVGKALSAAGEGSPAEAEAVAKRVAADVARAGKGQKGYVPTVEGVQDAVEKRLILDGYAATAKAFILYRSERAKARAKGRQVPAEVKRLAEESKRHFRNPLG